MQKIVEQTRLLDLRGGGASGDDQVVHLESYFSFIKRLRALSTATLEKDPEICRKIIHKLVQKIEFFPEGYDIHYFVGQDYIEREIAPASPEATAGKERTTSSLKKGGSSTLLYGGSYRD